MEEELFSVGVITNAHGVHGEFKVYPTTDDAKRFKKLKEVLLETKTGNELKHVQSAKFFKQFVILKLEGIDDMDTALLYKQKHLYVTRENAVKCEKDEYFISDLIGLSVYSDEEVFLGEISEVYQTGANDVYEIKRQDETKFLVPAIKECILNVDIQNKKMIIHLMEGLI